MASGQSVPGKVLLPWFEGAPVQAHTLSCPEPAFVAYSPLPGGVGDARNASTVIALTIRSRGTLRLAIFYLGNPRRVPLTPALDAIISLRFGTISNRRNRRTWQVEPAWQCSFSRFTPIVRFRSGQSCGKLVQRSVASAQSIVSGLSNYSFKGTATACHFLFGHPAARPLNSGVRRTHFASIRHHQ